MASTRSTNFGQRNRAVERVCRSKHVAAARYCSTPETAQYRPVPGGRLVENVYCLEHASLDGDRGWRLVSSCIEAFAATCDVAIIRTRTSLS